MAKLSPASRTFSACSSSARHARSRSRTWSQLLDIERYDRKQIKAALEASVAERKLRRIGKTRYQWVRRA